MAGVPPEVVLDASVIVKWFTEEKNTGVALNIRDLFYEGETTIYAPDLLVHEVGNALRYKPEVKEEMVISWIRDLFDMQLDLIAPSHELSSQSIRLAFEYGLSIYDSTYIALAELLQTKVITGDGKLYENAKDTGRVLRLEDVR